MPGKIKLDVIEGPMRGSKFRFEEHDTFLFGRDVDCHARLSADDPTASRHHFILEANPPDARIRDQGSLNGTWINGVKYGGRDSGETPEEGARHDYPEVDLKDGDRIQVGDTVFAVGVEVPGVCCECERAIADRDREKCAWIGGTFICGKCREKVMKQAEHKRAPKPVVCRKCGKDVAKEIGRGRRGAYVCESCRKKVKFDPLELLLGFLGKAGRPTEEGGAPKIPGYEVEEKALGIGGFGAVYLGRRESDGKQVAIKVMLSQVAVDEDSRKRFLREIEETKKFRHGNIVDLIDNGSAGTAFYFVMGYCPGGNVEDLMKHAGGRLTIEEAEPIMLQSLEGLAYIHDKNVVHRDLKPANILLTGSRGDGSVKISDLGLAKNFDKAGYSGMTVTGSAICTPYYAPREQLTNFKYMKPPSDVWSMGATFYNMLTGEYTRNFVRGVPPSEAVLKGKIVPIGKRGVSVPRKVAEVIDKAIAAKPKDRYQTGAEMLEALQKTL